MTEASGSRSNGGHRRDADATRQSPLIPIVIACVAALISTMLGIGGGVVMVPLLTLLTPIPIKKTAGTSLAVMCLVVFVGVIAQHVKAPADIHWPVSLVLAAGAIAGSFIGQWLNRRLPERVFRYTLCLVLVLVAARLVGLTPKTAAFLGGEVNFSNLADVTYLVAIGLIAGIVSALFGLGGGVIAVPALALAYAYFQVNFTATRATSLGMILPTSLVGAALHWKAGNVDVKLVGRMAPFAVAFAVCGVLLAYAVPSETLKVIFGVLLMIASARLALQKTKKNS
jgi:uncharacterized membrane protein YfcA